MALLKLLTIPINNHECLSIVIFHKSAPLFRDDSDHSLESQRERMQIILILITVVCPDHTDIYYFMSSNSPVIRYLRCTYLQALYVNLEVKIILHFM